ncbi:carbohydrate ABC transporter membrane protein 1, CUT1 family [Microlunatus sagamiharensis]|uniref:Carbohydrate ABC transporter membrane protein 1, CUT1 family n=1 Tax=Microlunatus sagamiharensis TaxID=546874 RepID=A0A1H2N2A0_9ACTN|nr:sugar ABC transporter permease [Microlunatus sagamiharensis]SDU99195.1 carbohydrate ABC transporter membrane protein 1, CUT1 family [Microlunatus sagamiharensis]
MAATLTVPPGASLAPAGRRHRGPGTAAKLLPLLPAVVLLLLFFAGPVVWSVYTAFTNQSLSGAGAADAQFIGLANFSRMVADPTFWHSIVLTVVFVVGSAVIGQNTLGLLIALLLRHRHRVTQTVVSLVVVGAWVMPEIVAAFCWYAFLNPDGSLNSWFGWAGFSQNWLYTLPMFGVILTNVWRGTAFSMMVYSAALSDIPPELEEAASVDGGSGWRRLWSITLPLIRRSILTNLMLITLQTLAVFTLIYVLTAGGPGDASSTTPIYMYEQAFQFYDLGYGTAMALVLLAVGAIFSMIYLKFVSVDER